jgi:Mn-dependent DtxR family transcriptional regulator
MEACAMANEELKQKVVEEMKKKSGSKSKFYFNDLAKIMDEKPRAAKKVVNEMVTEGLLTYWSSGSTTMYSLPGMGKQAGAEGEGGE